MNVTTHSELQSAQHNKISLMCFYPALKVTKPFFALKVPAFCVS